MPWPPTSETDFTIPIEWQLSAGMPAGLDAPQVVGTETPDSVLNASTDVLAPGALGVYDNPLDQVELIAQAAQARRDALSSTDTEATTEGGPGPLTNATGKRAAVIAAAKTKLGYNYVWGGESDSEGGYDCSGLLWYAFKKAGISMPRVSMAQAERGKRTAIADLQAGDLIAWENNPRQAGADHIALYLGDGMILEAPRTGLKVRIRKLSAAEMAGNSGRTWGVRLDY